jgi:hypothetical protein
MNSIRNLIADDSFAIGFQSMGQYRTALLKALDVTPPAPEDLATDQMMAANLSALLIKECGLHSPGSSAHDLLQRAAAMLVNYGLPAHSATPPPPPALAGEGRWSEGVCGDGAAILFDGVMIPIEEVVQALNRAPAAPPVPEVGEVGELVAYLQEHGTRLIQSGYANASIVTRDLGIRVFRAATLLQQQQHLLGLACAELDRMGAFSSAPPAPAVVPVAARRGWDDGFMAGVCVALATVKAHGDNAVWRDIVRSVGVDSALNYAANVNPEDWDLAGFSEYAQAELGKDRPAPLPQAGEVEA